MSKKIASDIALTIHSLHAENSKLRDILLEILILANNIDIKKIDLNIDNEKSIKELVDKINEIKN
jgi:hypothetical protein